MSGAPGSCPSHRACCSRSLLSPPSPHRFVVLFNPLEHERLSVVSLLVNSPRVRVFSEEGQPLAVQISPHWSSATDMVPDVYQVRLAGAPSTGSALPGASRPLQPWVLLPPHVGDWKPRRWSTFGTKVCPSKEGAGCDGHSDSEGSSDGTHQLCTSQITVVYAVVAWKFPRHHLWFHV